MKDRSYLATFSPCTLRKEVTFRAIMSCEHNKLQSFLLYFDYNNSKSVSGARGGGGRGGRPIKSLPEIRDKMAVARAH